MASKLLAFGALAVLAIVLVMLVPPLLDGSPPTATDDGPLLGGAEDGSDEERHPALALAKRVEGPSEQVSANTVAPETKTSPGMSALGEPPEPWMRVGRGRIVGRVVAPDGSALPVPDGAGRPGVLMSIAQIVNGQREVIDRGLSRQAVITREGWFFMGGLPAGTYELRFWGEGYATTKLRVSAGDDLVALRMERSEPLIGRVVDAETGEPIAGLSLSARSAASPRAGAVHHSTTRDDGGFRFNALAAGAYVIGYGHIYVAGDDAASEYLPAQVGPFPTGLDPIEVRVVRGQAIEGVLIDASGQPVSTSLYVEAISDSEQQSEEPGRRRGTTSRTDGSFRVGGLPTGLYTLSVRPRTTEASELGTTIVRGIAAGQTDVVVELGSGTQLRGRLLDQEDEPVRGTGYIYVYPSDGSPGSPGSSAHRQGPDGRFKTTPVDPATSWNILATGYEGYMPAHIKGVYAGDAEIVIRMQRGKSISGRVLDADGVPVVAGVGVIAFAEGQGIDRAQPGTSRVAYTDATGAFVIGGLGEHTFALSAGGGETAFVGPGALLHGIQPGAADVVLRVERGVPLAGRLQDTQGNPMKSGYLSARSSSAGGLASTTRAQGDEGRFLFPGVPPGTLTLRARFGTTFVDLGTIEVRATPEGGEEIVVIVPDM